MVSVSTQEKKKMETAEIKPEEKKEMKTTNPEVSTDPLDRALMIQMVQRDNLYKGGRGSCTEEDLKKLTLANMPKDGVLTHEER